MRQFARQAGAMEDPGYLFADGDAVAWLRALLPPRGAATLLDVAGGTGQVARAYADDVGAAVVLDATGALLERGRRACRARNVLFERGDAAALPYVDGSFELVVCRFAVHHFERPAGPLAEMVRVCRPDGRLAILDLVAAQPELEDRYNGHERLRDRSHTRALAADDLCAALERAGACLLERAERDRAVAVERWLAVTETPAERAASIRAGLEAELSGGAATGMRPLRHGGELHYTQRWMLVVARPLS